MKLPLNLGLNDGVYMPQAAVDALEEFSSRTALRNYTTSENDPLREAIARIDGVTPEHVFLRNGSGPILKQVFPYLVKERIKSSKRRIVKHLINKNGFPIITGQHTYSKVPAKASALGLTVHLVDLGPENGFKLDVAQIDACLQKGDGFVYIVNPNNPTGNVLVNRDEMIPLFERYPESRFWIDEAYVQYVDPDRHQPFSDLVPRFDNLVVSRTFSFAYGMASLRVGYLLGNPALVKTLGDQLTDYRIGGLAERLAVAALEDPEHLPFMRQFCKEQRSFLRQGMGDLAGVETFDSDTNFILCRFTDGRKAAALYDAMLEKGVKIKIFKPFGELHHDTYFRLTFGTPEENAFMLEKLREILG